MFQVEGSSSVSASPRPSAPRCTSGIRSAGTLPIMMTAQRRPSCSTASIQAVTCGEFSQPATRTRNGSATRRLVENSSQLLRILAARVALEGLPADPRLVRQPVLLPALPEDEQRLFDRLLVVRISYDARIPLSHQSTREVVRTGKAENRPARPQVFKEFPRRREARARHVEQKCRRLAHLLDRALVPDVTGPLDADT